MDNLTRILMAPLLFCAPLLGADTAFSFAQDPGQQLERTCFQTSRPYNDTTDLRSDVAIVYGIGAGLPERIQTWRGHGYRIHVMTGVSWGQYQDYLYGRFDSVTDLRQSRRLERV